MTFPSKNNNPALSQSLSEAQTEAAKVKLSCQQMIDALNAANAISSNAIFDMAHSLRQSGLLFNKFSKITLMDSYALSETGVANITAEASSIVSALQQVIATMKTTVATDANGYVLSTKIANDGNVSVDSVTKAQATDLIIKLQTVINLID